MNLEFYTNDDIQFLTGMNFRETRKFIKKINKKIKADCEKYHLEPEIYKDKVLINYFGKMGLNL